MQKLVNFIKELEKINKSLWIAGGLFLLFVIALLDYLTGYELAFSLFYVIPIAMVTWRTNGKFGIGFSIISASLWLIVDVLSGATYSNAFIYLWNSIIRFGFFTLTVILIRLTGTLEQERMFARTDFVTGTINTRFFHVLAQQEIDRSIRSQVPITVAFMDVDNFKSINDLFGHTTGDKVLGAIAECMQRCLRKTDLVARVGGDEFAILLPEVDISTAKTVITKMHRKLLEEMQKNGWPVTFSTGVLTFTKPPGSVDEVLSVADGLMYSVKNSGKNNISYAAHSD
jgi:diguanylate cyclase (GGDEF)-like protein